jgi:hypothetical protein
MDNTLLKHPNLPGNLVAHSLRWDNGNLVAEALVGVEIVSQRGVVLLDDHTRRLFDGLKE